MKWNHSLPLTLVFGFTPAFALAIPQSVADASQQPQEAIETSHAVLPLNIEPAVEAQAKAPEQSTASPRDQFQTCHQLASQVRDHARTVAKSAGNPVFSAEQTTRQHKQLQDSLGDLRQKHEQLFKALSDEQQKSVQMRNANLLQAHDRLQNLVIEMERELTGSVLHTKDVADQARATDREMKSFQKEFRAMGKDLGFAID
jgi:hypothetical protein